MPPISLHLQLLLALGAGAAAPALAAPALAAPVLAAPVLASGTAAPQAAGPRIDVAFVLDATGSMGPWIDQARCRIKAIAADLAAGEPAPTVRFALVRYRDRGDAYVVEHVPFSGRIEDMAAALDATSAGGGGDFPEAVLEGLEAALTRLAWSPGDEVARLVYLVGDAPPQVGPGRPEENALVARALDAGIVVHTLACGGHLGAAGQAFFDRFARQSEGRVFQLASGGDACGAARSAPVAKRGGAAEAGGATDLGRAVSGSARDYGGAVGVDFTAASPVAATPVDGLAGAQPSGLLGAQVRLVTDLGTFTDLWSAHRSVVGEAAAGPGSAAGLPRIDFSREHLLVLGGDDAGLELVALSQTGAARKVEVRAATPGVRFVKVPATDLPLAVHRQADATALGANLSDRTPGDHAAPTFAGFGARLGQTGAAR